MRDKITKDAFKKARKIHTIEEILTIHEHPTFTWKGMFEPLNSLSIEELICMTKQE